MRRVRVQESLRFTPRRNRGIEEIGRPLLLETFFMRVPFSNTLLIERNRGKKVALGHHSLTCRMMKIMKMVVFALSNRFVRARDHKRV